MYRTGHRELVKRPRRLAMEIKGKDPRKAYDHLLRYGLTEAEAAEVVALFRGRDRINGSVPEIAEAIQHALRAIPLDPLRIQERR